MKRIRSLVFCAAITALVISGCGGGGGTTTTTQPTYSSAKTVTTMMAMMMLGEAVGMEVMMSSPDFATATTTTMSLSKYATEFGDINCSWSNTGFDCTLTSNEGGTATMQGTWDFSGTGVMSADYQFDNFTLSGTTLNGGYTVDLFIDWNYSPPVTASVSKALPLKQTTGTCEISDDQTQVTDQSQSCTWDTSDQQTCDTQFAFFRATMTVGSEGYSVTNACGTYNFGPGTTVDMALCQTNIMNMSYSVSGSFNGESVDGNVNVTCEAPTI